MDTYAFLILLVNSICIALFLIITITLIIATRLKGAAAYLALIILISDIPPIAYNMFRSAGLYEFASHLIYYGLMNTTLLPLLWLFVHRELNPQYHFRAVQLLHFLPTVINIIVLIAFFAPLSHSERIQYLINETSGTEHPVQIFNDLIIFLQLFTYFPLIIRSINKGKKRFYNNYADSDYLTFRWIERIVHLFFLLFCIVFVCYLIFPRTDCWVIPILGVILMSYIVYNTIAHPTDKIINRLSATAHNTPTEEKQRYHKSRLETDEMAAYCQKITDWLKETQKYKDPNLSVWHISTATGIPTAVISQSLNRFLKKNFFDLVNHMRLEKAKQILLSEAAEGYTIESIATDCGFRSRSTFYQVFSKYEKTSPARWLKEKRTSDSSSIIRTI